MKELKYNGIEGLNGREPVGAVLTIGIKEKERGFPTETDRFHIVNPNEENGVRALHGAFKQFNSAAPDVRKMIRGNIVHAQRDQCFEFHLKAQVLKKAHPNRMPCCVGDGEKATRWMGDAPDNFKQIVCPHDKCEFRMTKPPLCKPFMRFLFRIRWNKDAVLPTPLMKFTSGSWNSTANFKGFFEHIETAARNLGLKYYTLFGFPFIMTLAYKTKPSDKSRFPVVTISPEVDVIEFFSMQREKIKQLSAPVPIGLLDEPESAVEVVYEDLKSVSIPSNLPAQKESAPVQVEKPAKNGKAPKAKGKKKEPVENNADDENEKMAAEKIKKLFARQGGNKILSALKVKYGFTPAVLTGGKLETPSDKLSALVDELDAALEA